MAQVKLAVGARREAENGRSCHGQETCPVSVAIARASGTRRIRARDRLHDAVVKTVLRLGVDHRPAVDEPAVAGEAHPLVEFLVAHRAGNHEPPRVHGCIFDAGAGILLLEVSQNSDVTYRLYDWDRLGEDGKPRPLHIEKALDVIQMRNAEFGVRNNSELRTPNSELLFECPKFSLELLQFEKYIEEKNNTNSFHILSFIEGEGNIQYRDNKKDFVSFSKGESVLIPASLKSYEIQPSKMCKVIKTSIK